MKEYERELMDFPTYRLQKYLNVYVSPFVIVIGLIGNILSVIVLSRPSMSHVSTYCYLTVLAVADTLVLTAGLLPKWLDEVATNNAICELYT